MNTLYVFYNGSAGQLTGSQIHTLTQIVQRLLPVWTGELLFTMASYHCTHLEGNNWIIGIPIYFLP